MSNSYPLRIDYRLGLLGPLHIGTGQEATVQADRLTLRDYRNLPYVPGSSLKGAVRAALSRLAAGLTLPVCGDACESYPCLVCHLCGTVRRPSALRFGDATLPDEAAMAGVAEFDPLWYDVRFGVQICRQRRIAEEGKLYTTEYARTSPDAPLAGSIVGRIRDERAEDFGVSLPPSLWALLCALSLVDRIGGNHSRGAGRVAIEVARLEMGGVDRLPDWKGSMSQAVDYREALELVQEEFA